MLRVEASITHRLGNTVHITVRLFKRGMSKAGVEQDLPVTLVEESMTGTRTGAVLMMSSSGNLPDPM